MQPSANDENEKTWQEISDEIKKIFKTAVKLLHEKGKMKHSQAKGTCSQVILYASSVN